RTMRSSRSRERCCVGKRRGGDKAVTSDELRVTTPGHRVDNLRAPSHSVNRGWASASRVLVTRHSSLITPPAMPSYTAPIHDIRFLLEDVIDAGQLNRLPGYEEATPELLVAVLEEAGRLCEEVLFPLNQSGDAEGCHFEN